MSYKIALLERKVRLSKFFAFFEGIFLYKKAMTEIIALYLFDQAAWLDRL